MIVLQLYIFYGASIGLRRFYFEEDSIMQLIITYDAARIEDTEPIYQLCSQLILNYESLENIDSSSVLKWVH